jgi:hypothetical protein
MLPHHAYDKLRCLKYAIERAREDKYRYWRIWVGLRQLDVIASLAAALPSNNTPRILCRTCLAIICKSFSKSATLFHRSLRGQSDKYTRNEISHFYALPCLPCNRQIKPPTYGHGPPFLAPFSLNPLNLPIGLPVLAYMPSRSTDPLR